MAQPAPHPHADQMFRAAAQAAEWSADLAAQLHLRDADRAGRHLRAFFEDDQKRSGVAPFRNRRQPFAKRDGAGGVDGVVAEDRGVVRAPSLAGSSGMTTNFDF